MQRKANEEKNMMPKEATGNKEKRELTCIDDENTCLNAYAAVSKKYMFLAFMQMQP